MSHILRATLVASLVTLGLLRPAASATFVVDRLADEPSASTCDPGVAFDCSLRGATTASNANPGKDTIIAPAGTYSLTSGLGQLVLSDDVEILGAEGTLSIIQQEYGSSGVILITASDVLLSNLVIAGGEPPQNHSGAGIEHRDGGRLELRDCRVSDNKLSEASGGGIHSTGGTVVLVDSEVSMNLNPDFNSGTGIYINDGELSLLRSTVKDNIGGSGTGGGIAAVLSQVVVRDSLIDANENSASWGAGIHMSGGSLTVIDSDITRNKALGDGRGGGIYLRNGATLTMTRSLMEGNSAGTNGGAIWNDGTVEILQSTIGGNRAGAYTTGHGGGIYGETGSNTTIVESLFVDNEAVGEGAGLLVWTGASATVTNSTFSGNTAGTFGGGIENNGVLHLASSTLTGNSAGTQGDAIDYSSGTTHLKNSLIDGTCGGFLPTVNSQGGNLESPGDTCLLDAPSDQVDVTSQDLALDELDSNGGPTFTHALMAGSVAIDGGVTSCPPMDQRGYIRQDTTCDVGAFEFGASMPGLPFTDGFESGDTSAWSMKVN